MQKQKNKERGITLIALVVTIIVLIILAGVSIAMLVGENGIITQAQRADELTTQAQQKEAIELAIASVQAQGTLELDKTKLETALQSQLGDTSYTLTENGDGSFLLQIAERRYYIDSTGKVITEENMIAIGSADELKAFRDDVNSGNTYEGKYVYLTSNITLNINEEWEPIGLYPMENSTPDAETNKPFSGIFDGKGYEVNGMYINTTDKAQGLFGLIIGGKILNLGIGENCNITGGGATGSIAGYLYDNSYVNNCYNKSNITVDSYSGGLFGQLNIKTKIENCYNLGDINIKEGDLKVSIGGITGQLIEGAQMHNCYNEGNINVNDVTANNIGGLVGRIYVQGIINQCYNNGQVNGNQFVGGIVGALLSGSNIQANIQVQSCYNTGDINGNSGAGGIGGINQGNIINCYSTGNISCEFMIGGIVGNNQGKLKNCYNIGNIVGTTRVGGIAGQNDTRGSIENSYSLEGVSESLCGINDSTIGVECSFKTSIELQQLYGTLGEEFKEDINNINNKYPVLIWQ